MSDLFTKEIYRPIGPVAWQRLVERATASMVGSEEEAPKIDTAALMEALKVTISVRSMTRREALLRTKARDEVVEYAVELTGMPREELDLQAADFEHAADIITRLQAVDILSCLDWDLCHGIEFGDEPPEWFAMDEDHWTATKYPADWVDAKDWFFTACADLAYEANPQLSLAQGQVPFG